MAQPHHDHRGNERLIGQALLFSGLGLLGLELTTHTEVGPLLIPAGMLVVGFLILESDHTAALPPRRPRRR